MNAVIKDMDGSFKSLTKSAKGSVCYSEIGKLFIEKVSY